MIEEELKDWMRDTLQDLAAALLDLFARAPAPRRFAAAPVIRLLCHVPLLFD